MFITETRFQSNELAQNERDIDKPGRSDKQVDFALLSSEEAKAFRFGFAVCTFSS